ncbi:MAG: hypothetical protein HYR84_08590 [Planctomycetes bacterium]|nr:hypothetical protein [Planctomycetota bacterium]
MKSLWSPRGRFVLIVCLASLIGVLASDNRASAQHQGRFVSEAAERLHKAIDRANDAGYTLHDNAFSIGGGWIKQSKKNWILLFTKTLKAGQPYKFLAAGDKDARDVDIEIIDEDGKVVAKDADPDATAVVNFTPKNTGKYQVRVRLYESRSNVPCVCLAIVMTKEK